jgi:NAD(P) transhydrogenase subunit beta
MNEVNTLQIAAYLFASILFILSLGGLSSQESAKRGVFYGIVGMAIAILATVSEKILKAMFI